MSNKQNFVFRKQEKIGSLDAKQDKAQLLENFVNTGDYNSIKSFDNPARFILGRTGSGKTALITKLVSDERHVITVEPEALSLIYISNSTIIKELSKLGVNFDLFFKMLWRHVLSVEVLKYHYDITSAEAKISVMDRLREKFSKLSKRNNHAEGLDYLESHGASFWQSTDFRIKEIVSNFENKLELEAGSKINPAYAKVKSGEKLNEQQTIEVVKRAQDVVDSFQVKALADILRMLDEAIDDRKKRYYLVIDRLDENWVDNDLRYRLIRALLETINDFSGVERVKPLVVLRYDLINRVFDMVKTPGFQKEKFNSLNLNLTWNRNQLTSMLDQRIDSMIKRQYSGGAITHKDVLVGSIGLQNTLDYMLDRTLMRPRDMISFYNFCIEEASESAFIDEDMLLKAERNYSTDRRSAILDEWSEDFPNLSYWDSLLESIDTEFFISDIDGKKVENLCLLYDESSLSRNKITRDLIAEKLNLYLEEIISVKDFTKFLLQTFYSVGYIGVKLPGYEDPIWSYQPHKELLLNEIKDDTIFCLHKCFWSYFSARIE